MAKSDRSSGRSLFLESATVDYFRGHFGNYIAVMLRAKPADFSRLSM
ncbi:MAG: hypothetical protein AAFR62_13060 [Cyanobacteria bacterium J06629_2]